MSKETYGDYSIEEIQSAMNRHYIQGRPEKRNKIRYHMERGEDIPADLMDFKGIRPEKEIEGRLDVPPRSGRGSGNEAWREFASRVSDMAPEVLEELSREEIWEILEDREILPKEEEDSTNNTDDNADESASQEEPEPDSQEESEAKSESDSEEDNE